MTTESEPARVAELAAALATVQQRVQRAVLAAGRDPEQVQLLPVSKFFPASDVLALYGLGRRAFGESRDQEASAKVVEVSRPDVQWHMVGSVQRNKAKSVASWAYSVHSVGDSRLIAALDNGAGRALHDQARAHPLLVYIQISLDGDIGRGGVDIADRSAVDMLCDQVASSDHLNLSGLMALPPRDANPDQAFSLLQQEHERVQRLYPQAHQLSAGMSNDLEVAIKYGSTCVRVGTALMGQRPLTSR